MTPTHRDAFVSACLAAPDDPAVRLVFADWLDDRADPAGPRLRRLVRLWDEAARMPVPAGDAPGLVGTVSRMILGSARLKAHWRLWLCLTLRCGPLADSRPASRLLHRRSRTAVACAELECCGLAAEKRLRTAWVNANAAAREHAAGTPEHLAASAAAAACRPEGLGDLVGAVGRCLAAAGHQAVVRAAPNLTAWALGLAERLPGLAPEFAPQATDGQGEVSPGPPPG